jgi:hypothetical protein
MFPSLFTRFSTAALEVAEAMLAGGLDVDPGADGERSALTPDRGAANAAPTLRAAAAAGTFPPRPGAAADEPTARRRDAAAHPGRRPRHETARHEPRTRRPGAAAPSAQPCSSPLAPAAARHARPTGASAA